MRGFWIIVAAALTPIASFIALELGYSALAVSLITFLALLLSLVIVGKVEGII